MNTHSSPQDDSTWQSLLAQSARTFQAEVEPPYGFVTSTAALLRTEKKERELFERIGLRALCASLIVLVAAGGFTVGVQLQDRLDLEPGLNNILQADDVPLA